MGLLSAAMLAELQKTNPDVYPLIKVIFPSITKLWGSTPVNVKTVGFYDGRVLSWGGPFVRTLSDRDGNLQTPSMTVTVDDVDLSLSNILEGADANRLRGSQVLITLASPNVASASWATILTGVLAGWKRKGLTSWDLSCQYNDAPLRGYVPKTAFTASDWPSADPKIYGTYVPIIYGQIDSTPSSGSGTGFAPTYLVDTAGGATPEYAISLGWLKQISRVFVNGTLTATYTVNHPVKNGRQYTTIKFTSAPPLATDTVTADVYGYESVGDGTGTLVTGPSALQHFLENFVFRDYQSGAWAVAGTYTDTASFTTSQAWAAAVSTQFTAHWIGGSQETRAMDEVASFLRSLQVHAFWTWGGKLGLLPFDLRDNTVWYDNPQWVYEAGGDVISPLDVSYDYQTIMDRISIQYLYSQAGGKYLASLEVRDQALAESVADSLQMPWGMQTYSLAQSILGPPPYTVLAATPAREAATYRLNRFRHPLMSITADLPLWAVDRELLDGLSWSHSLGPSSANMGPGWGKEKWRRRSSRIYSIGVDLDRRVVNVSAWDRRFIDCTLWDTMLTTKSYNVEAQGIPRILSGSNRSFLRSTKCWVPDPSDGTVREVAINVEAITADGYLSESAATNIVSRSAFKTAAGVGWTTLRGTITDDTTDVLWDTTITGQSRKIVSSTSAAGSGQMSHVTGTVGPKLAVAPGGRFSMSYKNDTLGAAGSSGTFFYYDIQRASDAQWLRDSDGSWQAAAQQNQIPLSNGVKSRFVSTSPFFVASSSDTLTLFITLSGGTSAGQLTGHVYDAQIEDLPFPTSRILTDGSAVTRQASTLLYSNVTALRQSLWPSAKGTLGIEFVADWDASVLSTASAPTPALVWQANDVLGLNFWALYYDASADVFRFHAAGTSGGVSATSPSVAGVLRGQRIRVVGRWTGTDGELGLPNMTLSCFAATTSGTLAKGTDVVRAVNPAQSTYGWLLAGARETQLASADFGASMKLWLKADAGVYKDAGVTLAVNNDTVQQWSDQSGNANNFIQAATSGPRPTYKTAIVNGQPVLRFAGAQSLATSSAALSTMLGTSGGGHIFVVFNAASYANGDPVWSEANSRAGVYMLATTSAPTQNGFTAFNTSSSVQASITQALAAATWACVEWIHSGTPDTLTNAVSGQKSSGTTSGATDATGVMAVAKRFDVGQFLTGDVAEVMVFNAELTRTYVAGGLDEVQEYFQRKYGFTFTSNPLTVTRDAYCANGSISRLRITPHVLADDELLRLFT